MPVKIKEFIVRFSVNNQAEASKSSASSVNHSDSDSISHDSRADLLGVVKNSLRDGQER